MTQPNNLKAVESMWIVSTEWYVWYYKLYSKSVLQLYVKEQEVGMKEADRKFVDEVRSGRWPAGMGYDTVIKEILAIIDRLEVDLLEETGMAEGIIMHLQGDNASLQSQLQELKEENEKLKVELDRAVQELTVRKEV